MCVLVIVVANGCSPRVRAKFETDVSRGDQKLSGVDETQKVEDVNSNDYTKMTQLDPNPEQEAMASYDKAIQDDPNNAEACYARGFAQLSHGNAMTKAVVDFTKAIEFNPEYARACLMRGRTYEALGDKEKAPVRLRGCGPGW